MRFHQSVTFLEMDELLDIARVSEDLGYDGIYVRPSLQPSFPRVSLYLFQGRRRRPLLGEGRVLA